MARETQLPAHRHRQRATDDKHEQPCKEKLSSDHLVVARENVVAQEALAVMFHMRHASRLTHGSFPFPQSVVCSPQSDSPTATAFVPTFGNRLLSGRSPSPPYRNVLVHTTPRRGVRTCQTWWP